MANDIPFWFSTPRIVPSLCAILASTTCHAGFVLSSGGKPECVIIQQSGATAPEQHALRELKLHLDQITGGNFVVLTNATSAPANAIIVGQGARASQSFPGSVCPGPEPEDWWRR